MWCLYSESRLVHHAWIPLAAKGGDRIDSPVNKNSELCVLVPLGRLILLQRLPVRPEGPLSIGAVDFFQQGGAFTSYLLLAFCHA